MNQRVGTGWQVLLADLSLILFIVTAASLSEAESKGAAAGAAAPSPRSAAVAVYNAEESAPPLRDWLATQAPDARQVLTIWLPYAPGGQGEALERAGALSREAGTAGLAVRIVVEPGSGPPTATLAYDDAF